MDRESAASPEYLYVFRRFLRHPSAMAGAILSTVVVFIALFAGWLAPYKMGLQDLSSALQGPSPAHWLGTDQFGRDVLGEVLYGSRASLTVGLVATGIAVLIGIGLGGVSGYFGGAADYIVRALVDISWSLPPLLFALFIVSVWQPGLLSVMIAIGLVGWAEYARVMRAEVLSLRERDFVIASIALGAGSRRIFFKHILPNCISPLIVLASQGLAYTILTESVMSFLGLGVQPPTPSWGYMLNLGRSFLGQAPWIVTFPGLGIVLTVLGFGLLGDGLRDIFDPELY
jgi:peptide/nickel transport system permease protein